RVAGQDAYLALLARTVPAAGGVDRYAVPARRVEQRHAGRHPHLRAVGPEPEFDPGGQADRGLHPGSGHGALAAALALAARVLAAPFSRARCAAIQPAPHGSLFVSRSAAFAACTSCGDRASMIALVRPLAMAIGRNAAPIACRSGM